MIARPAPAPAHVEAVLFDLGGTVLGIDHERLEEALARRGIAPPAGWVHRAERQGRRRQEDALRAGEEPQAQWRAFFCGMFEAAGAPADLWGPVFEELSDYHRRHHLWSRVLPGMPETLRALAARGYRVAAVSNSDGRAEWVLARVGLAHEFEFVVDSEIVGIEKPDRRIFELACARLRLHPQQCAYVGDLLAVDVEGSRAAGLWPVLIDLYGSYGPEIQPRVAEPAQLLGLFPPRAGREEGT